MAQSVLEMILRSRKQGSGAKEAKQELTDLKGAVSALGLSAQVTAAGGIAFLASQFVGATKRLAELERLENQTNAVIRSTGGVAGVSAQQVLRYAESLERTSLFEMEAVQNAENLLLTFTNIGKDAFPSATQAVVDMAAAMGGDLQGAAIQVGKALQDPILGVTALRRVGVNFSQDQMAVIKSLVDTGDAAKAQQLILKELATEFGGSAAAQAKGLGGQMHVLKESIEGVTEALAERALPTLTKAAQALNILLNKDKDVAQVLGDHEREVRRNASSYEAYVDEMLRANVVAGDLRQSQLELVRAYLLTGEGGMQARVALEGVTVATQGAFDAAQAYDDRLESIQRKGAITTYVGADTSQAEADLKEIAEKTPGTPEYWAKLHMMVEARAEDAITQSRLAFLEWLRTHPQMELTIIERVELASGPSRGETCFAAGTPVLMASGEERPIEMIRIGDCVRAFVVGTALLCEASVSDVSTHMADHLNTLAFSSGEVVQVTDEHPFLTPGGWIPVRELEPGSAVIDLGGRLSIVETRRRDEGAFRVFNLTVDGPHTYVVAGMVVHNKTRRARGGPLGRVSLVGEEGPEMIIDGFVIPAADTRRLMALGLTPGQKFGTGGAIDVETYGSWGSRKAHRRPDWKSTPPSLTDSTFNLDRLMKSDTGGGIGLIGGGETTVAAAAAVAREAAIGAAVGVGAQIPMAVAQQTAVQNAITQRFQQSLLLEVRALKDEIAAAVRDAVAQL